MYIKFWGTRGSIPVPGNDTLKYGGNTSCVEIGLSNNKMLILDAGSGIRELGKKLVSNGKVGTIDILFTHYHWDHIQGIPFFLPIFQKEATINFYGETSNGEKTKDILSSQMTSNYFPIGLDEMNAELIYHDVKPFNNYEINGAKLKTFRANHSSPTISYKITDGDKTIVYLTDNELIMDDSSGNSIYDKLKKSNKELIDFCFGCDYLIHDSMYDESSLVDKKGWGHSANVTLAYFGILSQVKNLILFHYNPDYTDAKIDGLLKETNEVLKNESSDVKCVAAMERLRIDC
jgi:phosphoribosyl 1,2-cyclic phosphodiesterase